MLLYFLAALLVVATAEVYKDGPCPDVSPMANFDLNSFQGAWYEIARYPNAEEEGQRAKCSITEYNLNGNKNKGKLMFSQVVDGVRSFIRGDVSHDGPARLVFTYNFGGLTRGNEMTILDTDYKKYAIGYRCKELKDSNKHQVFAWTFSRGKELNGGAKESVDNYLRNSPAIDMDKFVDNDHSDKACGATVNRVITHFLKF
uniref:Oviposition stimulant binding protein n=1 Tax=Byasa alcinous TaxID=85299 RepID=B2NIZ3_BYAAL|nr:oviposition stimulant binding protein [Byasa alcinous]